MITDLKLIYIKHLTKRKNSRKTNFKQESRQGLHTIIKSEHAFHLVTSLFLPPHESSDLEVSLGTSAKPRHISLSLALGSICLQRPCMLVSTVPCSVLGRRGPTFIASSFKSSALRAIQSSAKSVHLYTSK